MARLTEVRNSEELWRASIRMLQSMWIGMRRFRVALIWFDGVVSLKMSREDGKEAPKFESWPMPNCDSAAPH